MNNVSRVALQALAAVLGGTQSLHTNSMDESYALPTEEAVTLALRTQQIIAEETGVTNTVDPLAGSYFVESLTDQMESLAWEYINKLDKMGGMLRAIENGFPQKEIAEAAYSYQKSLETAEKIIVGINKYQEATDKNEIPTLKIKEEVEILQKKKLASFKAKRNTENVISKMSVLRDCCKTTQNIMPALIEAVDVGVTIGEVSDIYREVFGVYRDPGLI